MGFKIYIRIVLLLSEVLLFVGYVFVKYDNMIQVMETGDEPYASQATNPEHLIIL